MTDTPLTAAECKAIRTKMGLTQKALAEALNHHAMTVSRWERGFSPISHAESLRIRMLYRESTKSRRTA